MKQTREVVQQPAAQLDNLVIPERAQEPVHRLDPQTKGGAGRQRIRLRHEARHLAMARQQLTAEAALAYARLAHQQHEAKLAAHSAAQLVLQRPQFVTPPNELRA
jgi:hypothetical protein